MICIISNDQTLVHDLAVGISGLGLDFAIAPVGELDALSVVYDGSAAALVVDAENPFVENRVWLDLLAGIGRRIPVVIVENPKTAKRVGPLPTGAGFCRWVCTSEAAEVIATLGSAGALAGAASAVSVPGLGGHSDITLNSKIPIFDPESPLQMMRNHGALSMLTINASGFRKVAIEYGTEVYVTLQAVFQNILESMWGTQGSFRVTDRLCRRSTNSNIYYILLEQSRITGAIPSPGVLERLADRLVVTIRNALWEDMFAPKAQRKLPECIVDMPDFCVGFGTSIFNPCVDALEQLDQSIETSYEVSLVQERRMVDRHRELLQTIIQAPDLLHPNYQAVFHLKGLTHEQVKSSESQNSIAPLKDKLYGFESLIRLRRDALDGRMAKEGQSLINSKFLRPDVLFALAHDAKVSLELDQTCLIRGIVHGQHLPGALMVNILPRNLYHVDRLKSVLAKRSNLMFEVSESEAIQNFDLIGRIRAQLEEMNMGVAADDFGRGYGGLERVLRIQPNIIKLDRSLCEGIHNDVAKQAFVRGLVEASRVSKALILAEGVEVWEEAAVLQAMNVDLIQGFLLHKPQGAEVIMRDLGLEVVAVKGELMTRINSAA